MIDVFLSASIPLPNRHRRFYDTADILAIREAVKALVEIVLPVGRLTCGGHPTITPLLALFVREAKLDADHLTIFQSTLHKAVLPPENAAFADVRMINAVGNDVEASHKKMRDAMLASRPFKAAVFIGGMEGIHIEAEMFADRWPAGTLIPVGTTGAAASELAMEDRFPAIFRTERTYPTLFRRQLLEA
jgi:hypothetical protein